MIENVTEMAKHRALDAFGEADNESATTTVAISEGIYTYDPDGVPCAQCGKTSQRVWKTGRKQVCPACKEWSEDPS